MDLIKTQSELARFEDLAWLHLVAQAKPLLTLHEILDLLVPESAPIDCRNIRIVQ